MENVTKIAVYRPSREVFEAFVDPEKIGNFWFTSSSQRWEQGKVVSLNYEEYHANLDIYVAEIAEDEKIVFEWGPLDDRHTITITLTETLHGEGTIVEVTEEGFQQDDPDLIPKLLDNKEGWVYMLTCLKGYLEFDVSQLRAALVKG